MCACVRAWVCVCGMIGVDEARHVWRCGAGRVRRLGGDGREGGRRNSLGCGIRRAAWSRMCGAAGEWRCEDGNSLVAERGGEWEEESQRAREMGGVRREREGGRGTEGRSGGVARLSRRCVGSTPLVRAGPAL